MINQKTTAVRIIPVPGKKVGEMVEGAGFNRHKTKNATMILGLKLKSEFLEN